MELRFFLGFPGLELISGVISVLANDVWSMLSNDHCIYRENLVRFACTKDRNVSFEECFDLKVLATSGSIHFTSFPYRLCRSEGLSNCRSRYSVRTLVKAWQSLRIGTRNMIKMWIVKFFWSDLRFHWSIFLHILTSRLGNKNPSQVVNTLICD